MGYNYQATKFPRLKRTCERWHYDLQEEMKKRFSLNREPPKLKWKPGQISDAALEKYLNKFSQIIEKPVSDIEEIALKKLLEFDYNIIEVITEMIQPDSKIFKEVNNRIKSKKEVQEGQVTLYKGDERLQVVSYLVNLS